MMLMTCIAILAVDFRIFPRKFAKTETYGISLMDIGVGSFIISSALVSPKARESISHNTRLDKDIKHAQNRHLSQDHKGTSRISALLSTLRSIALLLFIGVSRFVVVKALNYQEHVTEYGVHWNFFLTLALVALFVAVLDISARWSGVVGTLLLCGSYSTLVFHSTPFLTLRHSCYINNFYWSAHSFDCLYSQRIKSHYHILVLLSTS